MRATIVIAVSVLVGSAARQLVPDSSRELADMEQQLAAAWRAGDRATIERIVAADWILTGLDGRPSTRETVLREVFETRIHRIDSIDIDDVRVRVFGDAAVVTGRTHGRGAYGGAAYDVTIRFTDVLVRRQGAWQIVASHASLATEPK
jgi:ketosteroid isomerase-like protein